MHPTDTTVLKWVVLTCLVFITACGSSSYLATDHPSSSASSEAREVSYVETSPPPAIDFAPRAEVRLRAEVADWLGTPYLYGGTGHDGLDCSAFVQTLFDELFDLTMPRTTAQQVRMGYEVPADALRAGDLVFFLPQSKSRHVGIYLNKGEFAHVSASQGVTISRLNEPYWRNSYWTARRILLETPPDWAQMKTPDRVSTPRDRREESHRSEPRRIGW